MKALGVLVFVLGVVLASSTNGNGLQSAILMLAGLLILVLPGGEYVGN